MLTVFTISLALRINLETLQFIILFQDQDLIFFLVDKLVSDRLLLLFHFPSIYSIAYFLSINGATDNVDCISHYIFKPQYFLLS